MQWQALRTSLQGAGTRRLWEPKREKRILEALSWSSGTQSRPHKHLVATLPNGVEVYFLKPGKEVFNTKRPNPHDMLPVVGDSNVRLKFDDVWSGLSSISVINFESFKMALTLIYRNAYFLDHVEKQPGIIRYEPSRQLLSLIKQINDEVGGTSPLEVLPLLHFLDILGWNEDMKYNVQRNMPNFSLHSDYNVGRVNTLLTCIRVPYQASVFVEHVLEKAGDPRSIDFSQLFTIMQQFAKSRGTCTPTQQQLITWLSPYIK